MSVKTVNIYIEDKNNDVEKSFDAVVLLYQNGFLTREDEVVRASKDCIETEGAEFRKVYSDGQNSAAEFALTPSGATWFSQIGAATDSQFDSAARWQKFLETISTKIHKQYSFFEYSPRRAEVEDFVVQTDKKMIGRLYQLLKAAEPAADAKGVASAATLKGADGKDAALKGAALKGAASAAARKGAEGKDAVPTADEDIGVIADTRAGENDVLYGVTLRLAVSDGSGEALPILGKIFFRLNRDEHTLQPLGKRQAQSLSTYINSCVTEADGGEASELRKAGDINDYSAKLEGVKMELKKLFESDGGFQDYLYLFDERDRALLDGLVERGPNNEVHISCRSAKILSVFYLNWQQRCYYIKACGNILYQVLIGYNNSFTVSCKMCTDGRNILDGNRLVLTDEKHTVLEIDPQEDHFGLDAKELELLYQYNPFKAHANRKICSNVKFGKECVKYVCDERLFQVDQAAYPRTVAEKDRCLYLCKDCDNIERVAMYKDKYYHTAQMTYASDIRGLIPVQDAKVCGICGRVFAQLSHKGAYCATCEKIKSTVATDSQRKLYRKYAAALSPLRRVGAQKRTVEDDEVVMMKVGESIYRLEKCELDGRTILTAPKRVDKR